MAQQEHIDIVRQGAESIAEWREENQGVRLDLSGANLRRASLEHADLSDAILTGANLEWADLRWVDLMTSDLAGALLSRADLHKADMTGANLSKADLADTNFEDANCQRVNFDEAVFLHTRLLCTDLRNAIGLEKAKTLGPSFLDAETITQKIRDKKLGTATVYFVFLGLPTGNAVNILPIMPSIVLMKTSSPQGRPVFVF